MGTDLIKAFLTAFLGALAGGLATYLFTLPRQRKENSKELLKRLEATEDGIKSLLRSEIQAQYQKICNPNRKYAKPYEKHNVSYLYKSYTDMGGNSYVSELFEQIMHKPIEPEFNKEKENDK